MKFRKPNSPVEHLVRPNTMLTFCGIDAKLGARYDRQYGDSRIWRQCDKCRKLGGGGFCIT